MIVDAMHKPALRMLRDCGVIRTRFDHDGLQALWEEGLAQVGAVEGDDDALDYRLTAAGHVAARNTLAP